MAHSSVLLFKNQKKICINHIIIIIIFINSLAPSAKFAHFPGIKNVFHFEPEREAKSKVTH